jgi:hypothetical protein
MFYSTPIDCLGAISVSRTARFPIFEIGATVSLFSVRTIFNHAPQYTNSSIWLSEEVHGRNIVHTYSTFVKPRSNPLNTRKDHIAGLPNQLLLCG